MLADIQLDQYLSNWHGWLVAISVALAGIGPSSIPARRTHEVIRIRRAATTLRVRP